MRIKVFSCTEHERYQRLSSIEASSIEINLSGLSLDQINDSVVFERAVISDPTTRSWIRTLRGEMLMKRAADKLCAEVVLSNDQWKQERVRLQVIEEAKRVEQETKAAAHAAALAVHRQAQLEGAEVQRATGLPVVEGERGARERREEVIGNQILRAARYWGGQAVEFFACCLLSPPGSQFCFFCTQ